MDFETSFLAQGFTLILLNKTNIRRVKGGWCSSRSSKPLSVRERAEVGSIPTLSANFLSFHG